MQQAATRPLERIGTTPRLYVQDDFVSKHEVDHVLDQYGTREALDAHRIEWSADDTGLSGELPVENDPVLEQIAARIEQTLGFGCSLVQKTFRFRRYALGDSHPLHVDAYVIAGAHLVVTALVYLTDATEGGETEFPHAKPQPARVASKSRRLVMWFNHEANGDVDRASLHRSVVLGAGDKATIAYFVYAPLDRSRVEVDADRTEVKYADKPVGAHRFVCVDDGVPEATLRVLREACDERGVLFEVIDAQSYDFAGGRPIEPGAMLFRPAISLLATRVEQVLCGPGVATFYTLSDGVFRSVGPDLVMFERAGVPVPKWLWGTTTNRTLLRKYVDVLGGFPIVMKFPATSGGVGVLRIDSLAGLFSTMDHARASGRMPVLQAFVPDAVHWRCIVVGDKVVGFYRNHTDLDDFRTHASDDPDDYRVPPSRQIQDSAIRATAALDVELGGVDVLEDPRGRHYVIEANFPCYFARARLVGGHDVGGAMIDWLARKADGQLGLAGRTTT